MRRRSFLAGAATLGAVLPSLAQTDGGAMRRIGVLASNPPWAPVAAPLYAAFYAGLDERGWVEGRNLLIEGRYAAGRTERFGEFAAEFVALVSELRAQNNPGTEASINNSAAGTTSIEEIAPPRPDRVPCLFIDKPVRSGQIIEFPAGDVTVIGSVGSGAEINAGGSIHVYGTLRGRALAGTAGDCAARIFCRSFHAELMAINGYYRVADNLDPSLRGRPIQARLEGLRMTLNPLDLD